MMIQRTVLILAFCCFLIASFAQQQAGSIYVATTGKATATGSFQDPVNDITTALRKARELVERHLPGVSAVHIYLRKGTYYAHETIELVEGKTWTSTKPLFITAYNNEQVILHGGKMLETSAATKVKDPAMLKIFLPEVADKIRQIDLAKAGITDIGKLRSTGFSQPYGPASPELFINGNAGRVAQWPNQGTVRIAKLIDSGSIPRWGDTIPRGGKFTYEGTQRPSRWKHPENGWLYGFFMWGYADETVPIKTIDTVNRVVTTALPSMYGFGTGKPWRAWYAFNLPEEIDTTGEYYIDRDKKILYFLPPDKVNSLEVSLLETPVIAFEGVKNVTLGNIIVTCSRGMGIYMERTTGVRIKGCTFSNLGMMAVSMGRGILPFRDHIQTASGTPAPRIVGSLVQHVYENSTYDRQAGFDNGILDCEIYQTGAGGIFLSGGDRVTLQPGNSFVQNCSIHDFNRLERTHRPGIWISGVGNRISNCEVFNAPSLGVLLHGNNHIFEFNNLHHVAREVDDMGAFYYGRDPSEQGNIVRNNYFHHIGGPNRTMAVYHDDGACGMQVYNNVFYKAGTIAGFIGGGRDNKYTNNIFIDTRYATHIDDRLDEWAKAMLDKNGLFEKRLHAVNFDKPPYSIEYPLLKNYFDDQPALPKRDSFTLNLVVNIGRLVEILPKRPQADKFLIFTDDNLIVQTDPGFVSFKNEDFRLKKDSEVWKKMPGFRQIPFEKIGYHAIKKE